MIRLEWINTLYPFEHSAIDKWKTILVVSIFLSLILILLQPYGFDPLTRSKISIGYFGFAVLPLTINYFAIPVLAPRYFQDESWSIKKSLLFLLYNFIVIGCWIHIYNTLIIKSDVTLLVSATEISMTLLKMLGIGFITSSLLILIRYNMITRQHLEASESLNLHLQGQLQKDSTLVEHSDAIEFFLEGKTVPFYRSDLLYIRSEGNYLSFHLKSKVNAPAALYRGRMKDVDEALHGCEEMFRCHRSYIVNLNFVSAVRGNSQGLNISLTDVLQRIPVARPKIKELRRRINEI